MKKKTTFVSALFWALLCSYLFLSFSNNPPNGYTGAPPTNNTCSASSGGCHSGGTNSGNIALTGLPATITPNTTYPISVTLTRTNSTPQLGGFQTTILDANNNFVGSFSNPGPSSTTQTQSGITYFEHNPAVFFGGGNDITYTVDWTAPASGSGLITMYAAGNFANGNGNNGGDFITTQTASGTMMGGGVINVVVTGTNVSCFGGSNGTATANASGGGGGPYTYMWSNGGNTQTIMNLPAGTYTVTVTNAVGGNGTGSVIITQPPLLTASIINQTNINCLIFVGSATAQGAGGTGGYTYVWSNGLSGATVPLSAGTHTVTVTDGNACTATANVTIISNTTPPITEAGPPMEINCDNPTVTLNGTGTSIGPNFVYQWTTSNGLILSGGNTLNPSVGAEGNYTLTTTNTTNGCTSSDNTTVTNNLAAPTANAGADSTLTCATAEIQLDGSASSMGAGFTYLWTTSDGHIVSGETTPTPTVDEPGTYCIEVTNMLNGCTSTDCTNVGQNVTTPLADAGPGMEITCSSSSVMLDGTGSSSGSNIAYLWTTLNGHIVSGDTTTMPEVDSAGTYTLIVTNTDNGCSASSDVSVVSGAAPPVADAGPGMEITCTSSSVTLDGTGSSSGANIAYLWTTLNGHVVSGDTTTMPEVDSAGTYTLTVTNTDNGCTASSDAAITFNMESPVADAGPAMALNCNNTSIMLNGSGSSQGGNFNYEWEGPSIVSGGNTATPTVDSAGTYLITVTDTINGCIAMDSTIVTQTPALSATISSSANVTCNGGGNGDATVIGSGGNGSYSFEWSNGDTTAQASNLVAGVYSVTITDEDDCAASTGVTITEPDVLSANASATGESSAGANDGTATASPAGGVPGYTYVWSSGDTIQTITGLTPGNYMITVTDMNDCTTTETVTVSSFDCSGFSINLTSNNPSCNGNSDGEAMATPSGGSIPYIYNWSTGDTTAATSGLAAGTYTVTISDGNNCEFAANITLTEPSLLGLSVTGKTNVDCNGASTGSATVEGTGGTPGYTYTWSNGGSGVTQNGLSAGGYTVTVTDANGCINTVQLTITEPPVLSGTITITNETAVGANDGTASISISGGTPGYTYAWDNGETTASINGLEPGEYCVTATDINGCVFTGCVTINAFNCSSISLVVSGSNVSCFGGDDGSASATAIGFTEPISYQWSNDLTEQSIGNLIAGTYNVSVSDANGCTGEEQIEITEPEQLNLELTGHMNNECEGQSAGSATVAGTGGTPGYEYAWSNGATGPVQNNLAEGTFDVTLTDANGCTATIVVVIGVEPDTAVPVAITQDISVALDENGKAVIFAEMIDDGSFDNCTLDSMTIDTGVFDCDNLGENEVILTVWDNAGNSATDTAIVTVVDETPPVVICPDTITMIGCDSITVEYPTPTASDNCAAGNAFILSGLPSGSMFPVGINEVTWGAEDQSGNLTACTFSIIIMADFDVNISFTEPTCAGNNDGTATATPVGGAGPFTFAWNDDDQQTTLTATDLSAGTYSVTVTDASGCETVNTIVLTEPEQVVISVDEVAPETNSNMDGTVFVTVEGGTGELTTEWFLDGNFFSNDEDLTGLNAGTYVLLVADMNGCTLTDSVVVENVTGTSDTDMESNISLFPNPVSGNLNLSFNLNENAVVNVTILDLNGRPILPETKEILQSKTISIDLGEQVAGIYIVKIVVDEAVVVKKVLVGK